MKCLTLEPNNLYLLLLRGSGAKVARSRDNLSRLMTASQKWQQPHVERPNQTSLANADWCCVACMRVWRTLVIRGVARLGDR